MKKFTKTSDCFNWINSVAVNAGNKAIEEIAKEAYKDSKDYTYIDTGTMYGTGKNSDFEHGYVLIQGPQVRRLYYGNFRGHKNANAVPQWFEKIKLENMDKYKKIYIENFNKEKGK